MIGTLLVGLLAGFAAGKIMKGRGFGLIVNILLGLGGALLGRFVFEKGGIELTGGLIAAVVQAMIGAIIILGIANILGGKSK